MTMTEQERTKRFVRTFIQFIRLSMLVMLGVCARIIYLQFFAEEIYHEENGYQTRKLIPSRGSILSFDGKPLAESITYYKIYMDLTVQSDTMFRNHYEALADSLSALFGDRSGKEYRKHLNMYREGKLKKDGKSRYNRRYAPLGDRALTYSEVERLKTFPILSAGEFGGGRIIEQEDKREHPYGTLARKVVGSINSLGEGSGLEKSFDVRLRGTEGSRKYQRQAEGRWIPVQGIKYTPAVDGIDIRTTIDLSIQEASEKALREQLLESPELEGGCVIVMDVHTGAVRALANLKRESGGKFTESYNYATGHPTEPGSTLKLSCLLAILEDGYATLDTPVDGFNGEWRYGKSQTKFSDTRAGGYGKMTVKTAFEHSSNVAFSQLAVRYYEKNPNAYLERIHSMKLGDKLNLEIGEDASSTFHAPGDGVWSETTLPMMGIGYGVMLTPLHTLTFYNAVANEGKMMKPYLVEAFSKDGMDIETFEPTVICASICSKKTIAEAKKALRGVITDGTGKILDNDRYHVSGKTGTAQMAFRDGKNMVYKDAAGNRIHQASLAGFFPSEDPQYSCIVVLYTGKTKGNYYGASWAGPVFKKVADAIYATHADWSEPLRPEGVVSPDRPSIAAGRISGLNAALHALALEGVPAADKETGWITSEGRDSSGRHLISELAVEKGVMPDVRGMGLRDAIYLLENEGYKVSFTGHGRVQTQDPAPGAGTEYNTRTILTLK